MLTPIQYVNEAKKARGNRPVDLEVALDAVKMVMTDWQKESLEHMNKLERLTIQFNAGLKRLKELQELLDSLQVMVGKSPWIR